MARRKTTVVFDLDDTLYPERDYIRSGYRHVARFLREDRGTDQRYEDWLWEHFLGGQASGAFDALNERFDLSLEHEDILRLVDIYRRHQPEIQPFPGIPVLLERLKKKFHLGLLSDGFLPAQQFKLDALGIESLFDTVVFTEAMGRSAWKPSPAGFEKVSADLSVPHHCCVYVSDNPAKDFVAPNELGWLSVQYRREGQIHADSDPPPSGRPQVTVHSDEELLAVL